MMNRAPVYACIAPPASPNGPVYLSKRGKIMDGWLPWALLSAVFAALTAILAKAGLRQVDADLATLIRTGIIALVLSALSG
jgi:hypothetical protein